MELWDAYDKNMNRVGGELLRGKPIPEGLFHLVCEALILHRDGSILVMKRHDEKESNPGLYEASAGGSAMQGEDPLSCIEREVFEETGVVPEELICYGVSSSQNTHYVQYVAQCACEKDSILLQEGETTAYQWVTRNQLQGMIDEGLLPLRHSKNVSYLLKVI